MILGVAQLPELRSHSILVRHIVHSLDTNDFEEAVLTLTRAYDVFGLSPLDELRRFIENHLQDIVDEIKTDDWQSFVKMLGRHSTHWNELTHAKSVPELIDVLREIRPMDEVVPDYSAQGRDYSEKVAKLSVPAPHPQITVAVDPSHEVTEKPLVQNAKDSTPAPSVNLRAATLTFLIVVSLALAIRLLT